VSSNVAAPAEHSLAARIERLPFSTWHLRVGIIIGSSWFFDGFDALAIADVLPVPISLWSLTPGQVGLMISIGYAGQAIGSIFFGWIAEKVGRVPCALYSLLIFSVMSWFVLLLRNQLERVRGAEERPKMCVAH
jgi:MFS transporter, putative metabolite:H+ symporter